MRLRPEARVGLVVFLALIALVVVYWFFGGLGLRGGAYPVNAVFPDAMRLSRGAEVRMAGVLIGKVQSIDLTGQHKAKVVVNITREYSGRIPEDSIARVTSGGVVSVGDYYIEVLPGKSTEPIKPNGYLRTQELPNLQNMVGQVQGILTGLQKTVNSVNGIVSDPKLHRSLTNIVANVEETTAKTTELTEMLQSTIAQNTDEINAVMANVSAASRDFAQVGTDVRRALEEGGLENIQTALNNATAASENLAAASLKLRELAEDPNVNADLRSTVKNANEATKSAAELVGRLNKVLGGGKSGGGTSTPSPAKTTPGVGSTLDVLEKGSTGDFRVDYNFTFAGRGNGFYRLGLYDIGESTKLNLQLGKNLDKNNAIRYGLYASRIGVGYDRRIDDKLNVQLDLYRPNDPRLEAKIRYDLNSQLGAWLGVEDVFGDRRALLGLQYRP